MILIRMNLRPHALLDSEYKVEDASDRDRCNIKRLMDIGCYRASAQKGLPVVDSEQDQFRTQG